MAQTVISRERLRPHSYLPRFPDLTLTQRHSNKSKVNTNSSKVVREPQLILSATSMQVVHATNGRIRIKATDDSFSSDCENIVPYLRRYPAVKDVTINERTSSLVVSFDERQISLSQMLGILQRLNIQITPDSPVSDPFAAWKSAEFWKEQTISFIPLMAGLAVTSRLGISGLASIPVYMITADAARRVIDYLKPRLADKLSGESIAQDDTEAVSEASSVTPSSPQHPAPSPPASNQPPIVKKDRESVKWSAKVTYSVIHQIPGRIRFHIPILSSDRAYGRRLEKLLQADPVVESVRINHDAASIAIAYKANAEIAVSRWVSLMESALETTPAKVSTPAPQSTPATSEPVVTQQMTEPENITTTDKQTVYISSWWAEMKYSALSYSLNFMANLPL
ncbi:HMA2 domain-containing protein [Aliinostoc sp. HNIBRCY26]|uniref:HMA2 domain-containing protein n=1 Tax=Aliinostoc sp. HNIBRCY26 TaxID=3418997 RepID=UPI003CFDBE7C